MLFSIEKEELNAYHWIKVEPSLLSITGPEWKENAYEATVSKRYRRDEWTRMEASPDAMTTAAQMNIHAHKAATVSIGEEGSWIVARHEPLSPGDAGVGSERR